MGQTEEQLANTTKGNNKTNDMPQPIRIALIIYFFTLIATSTFILVNNWQANGVAVTEKQVLTGSKINQTITVSKNQTSITTYNSTSMILPNGHIQKSEIESVKPIGYSWSIFGTTFQFSDPDIRYILTAGLFGILGSSIRGVHGLTVYAANSNLGKRWGWWYLTLPPIGLSLAVIVFVCLRAGLLTGNTVEINYYGIAAIGALVGLSTSDTMNKLQQILDTLFGKSKTPDPITPTTTVSPKTSNAAASNAANSDAKKP